MNLLRRGSFDLMKKMNQQVILKLIYNKRAISRAEIAEITGLSPATVTNISKEMLEMELIQESSWGESRGGRKPVLLEVNPDGAYFIGLEWGISEIRGVLMDLNKRIIAYGEEEIKSYQVDSFIELSSKIANKFYNYSIDEEKIYGMGVGVHGLVDPEKGYSLFAPHFKWSEIPIKEKLEEGFDLPVIIDNDVRVMAVAEKWNGRDNFLFINTGSGIGAAIVLNGNVHYGRDYSAGEFGHMIVERDGPLCSCGNNGCLEAFISLDSLVQRYNGNYTGENKHQDLHQEWLNLLEDARTGTEEELNIIESIAEYLGLGLANIINLLNPEEIIIGGDLIEGADLILPLLQKSVAEKSLNIPGRNLTIEVTAFGKWVGAIGGATMVLEQLFNFQEGI